MDPPTRRLTQIAAAALAACALGSVVVGVRSAALLGWSWSDAVESFLATNATMGLTFAFCGALVAWHRPSNPVGWLLGFDGLGHALSAGAAPLAVLLAERDSTIAARIATTVFAYSWPWSIALFLPLALLLFPDGRPLSSRWRWLVIATVLTAPLFVLSFGASPVPPSADVLPGYLTIPASADLDWLWTLAEVRNLVLVLALLSLFLRYRGADEKRRRQLLWVLLALLLVVPVTLVWGFVGATPVGVLFAIPLIPIAITVAVLRDQLFDIRLVVSRTLVYVVLSTAVLAAYVGLVALIDAAVSSRTGTGVVVTLAVALAFGPARVRLQRVVDRALYGDRHDPAKAIGRVGERLAVGSVAGLSGVVEAIAESLRAPYVGLRTAHGTSAEVGTRDDRVEDVALRYADEVVGTLSVGLRRGEAQLSAADRRLLSLIAAPLAVAVHALRLSADLGSSRRRVVSAREDERRRLRRDLHDQLGPALTAVAYQADAAANLMLRDPAESERLMHGVADQTRTAIGEIRRIVYGLRPPALDQLGLVGALQQQLAAVRRRDGVALAAVLDAAGLPALPPAVEVAAYRIVTEAVTNAARHSLVATRLDVRLRCDGDLLIEVLDDGEPGTDAWPVGVGTAAMKERAGELGGTCEVGPTASGGRVRARLPAGAP
ncbi:MAG: two-component sensor histidine kinase [Sporichthyaceae bacterium]|nr:two-component sensor histidine kinase [Sporichthyaceae bacterium]